MEKILIICICFLISTSGYGQKKSKQPVVTLPAIDNVVIDGELKEWSGKLIAVNQDSSWSYSVARNGDYLYAAVKIKDKELQNDVVRWGITMGVHGNVKKKDGAELIYPVADREDIRELAQSDEYKGQDIRQVLLNTARGYQISGFQSLVNGNLSFSNNYGIQAQIRIDEHDDLCYEAVVPVSRLEMAKDKAPVGIQLQLNTMWSVMARSAKANRGRTTAGGRPYATPQMPKNQNKIQTEVWVLTILDQD
ncbi:hypothetical protein [Sphingobacterium spiritivorum]|nr:hypothetical protein [Sphingobacterium spiritivorum]